MYYEFFLVCNSIRCESIGYYSICSRSWYDRDFLSLVYFCYSCYVIYLCMIFYFYGKVMICMFLFFNVSKYMFIKKFLWRDWDKFV